MKRASRDGKAQQRLQERGSLAEKEADLSLGYQSRLILSDPKMPRQSIPVFIIRKKSSFIEHPHYVQEYPCGHGSQQAGPR